MRGSVFGEPRRGIDDWDKPVLFVVCATARRSTLSLKPMSAYRDALVVDDSSTDQRLALAAAVLERCEGVVLFDGVVALRPTPHAITCEVIDPAPNAHRCAEEFKVLVDNARLGLANSKLSKRLPSRPLEWLVVDDYGSGTVQLWPGL